MQRTYYIINTIKTDKYVLYTVGGDKEYRVDVYERGRGMINCIKKFYHKDIKKVENIAIDWAKENE